MDQDLTLAVLKFEVSEGIREGGNFAGIKTRLEELAHSLLHELHQKLTAKQ